MDSAFERRLSEIEAAFEEVEASLGDPAVLSDPAQLAELGKRHSDMKDVVVDIRRRQDATADLSDAREMSDDPDMVTMATDLESEIESLEAKIKIATA